MYSSQIRQMLKLDGVVSVTEFMSANGDEWIKVRVNTISNIKDILKFWDRCNSGNPEWIRAKIILEIDIDSEKLTSSTISPYFIGGCI